MEGICILGGYSSGKDSFLSSLLKQHSTSRISLGCIEYDTPPPPSYNVTYRHKIEKFGPTIDIGVFQINKYLFINTPGHKKFLKNFLVGVHLAEGNCCFGSMFHRNLNSISN
jgi:hypothetical protein